jgi:hypothetical protein
VEPEETSIARLRLGKQVSVATDTQIAIEELLGTMFSIRSVRSGYKEESVENWQSSSGVPSEQSVESWALQGRVQKMTLRFRVWSANQRAKA